TSVRAALCRLWLQDDYDKAPKEERAGIEATAKTLEKHIEIAYAKAVQRDDIEALPVEPDRKLPDKGPGPCRVRHVRAFSAAAAPHRSHREVSHLCRPGFGHPWRVSVRFPCRD